MNRALSKYSVTSVMFSVILIAGEASAAENLYSVVSTIGLETGEAPSSTHINLDSGITFKSEELFNVLMPAGGMEIGKVTRVGLEGGRLSTISNGVSAISNEGTLSTTVISLENNRGSLEVTNLNNQITSILLYDNRERRYFRANIDSSGAGSFKEEGLEKYQCPELPTEVSPLFSMPEVESLVPDLNTVQNLESKPGASKTLYLNNWGGTLTDTAWNDSQNSGNPIAYTAFDNDNDPSTFSTNERYLMWLAWQEVAEDYASFDVNVTTKQSIYDTTASTNRSQIIATTTNYFYTGAGGVAYVGIFGLGDDYFNTGFTWNLSAGSMGMTHSHEAGHQMGLRHDGTSSLGYYSGHGSWGPIMGAPFGKSFVQWSKGEYPDASNDNDDLATLSNVLGVSSDDAGNAIATATPLALPITDQKGHIRPDGISVDTDVYSFTLTSSQTVDLEVISQLGDEGESRAANLAMNVSLTDSSNNSIGSMTSSDDLPLNPSTNKFTYSGMLAAGTYYISVTGVSPDQNWSTGFGEYGNEGVYHLSAEASGGPANPDDLSVSDSSLSSNSVEAGQSVTGFATQAYTGDKTSSELTPNPSMGYYLSADTLLDASDTLLATDTSSIGSDVLSEDEDAVLTIPLGTSAGTYYVLFVADDNDDHNEGNEGNNVQAVQLAVSAPVVVSGDDLYVTGSRLSSETVQAGKFIKAYTTHAYTGDKKNSQLIPFSYVGYFLSEDDQLDESDTRLATDVSKLGTNNLNDPEWAKLKIPSFLPGGTYHILFVADYKESHDEENEANNVEAVQFTVPLPAPDDLYVSNSRLSSNTVKAGKKIKAYTTHAYTGDKKNSQLKPYSYVGYYLSEDNLLDDNDILLAKDLSKLGTNNKSDPESANLKIPASTSEGIHYILFVADYKEAHDEENESNNVEVVEIVIK